MYAYSIDVKHVRNMVIYCYKKLVSRTGKNNKHNNYVTTQLSGICQLNLELLSMVSKNSSASFLSSAEKPFHLIAWYYFVFIYVVIASILCRTFHYYLGFGLFFYHNATKPLSTHPFFCLMSSLLSCSRTSSNMTTISLCLLHLSAQIL